MTKSAATAAGALLRPRKPPKEPKVQALTQLEQDAINTILFAGLPEGEAQYRFCGGRFWRFDRAWAFQRVALELEGGVYQKGGGWHQSIQRYTNDCEKYSEAAVLGWTVIRCTAEQVRSGQMLDWLTRALGGETPNAEV